MNLPNKLTVLRIIMTPFFMAFLMFDFGLPYKLNYCLALLIFVVASITDYADGQIARKHNLITSFGKFLDPLADKMLTTSALIGFVCINFGNIGWNIQLTWIVFIVLFREFLIASLRLVVVSSEKAKVIPANIWGKLKTVAQMVAIIFTLVVLFVVNLNVLPTVVNLYILPIFAVVLLWISTVFAVISGYIYLKDNKEYIDSSK